VNTPAFEWQEFSQALTVPANWKVVCKKYILCERRSYKFQSPYSEHFYEQL